MRRLSFKCGGKQQTTCCSHHQCASGHHHKKKWNRSTTYSVFVELLLQKPLLMTDRSTCQSHHFSGSSALAINSQSLTTESLISASSTRSPNSKSSRTKPMKLSRRTWMENLRRDSCKAWPSQMVAEWRTMLWTSHSLASVTLSWFQEVLAEMSHWRTLRTTSTLCFTTHSMSRSRFKCKLSKRVSMRFSQSPRSRHFCTLAVQKVNLKTLFAVSVAATQSGWTGKSFPRTLSQTMDLIESQTSTKTLSSTSRRSPQRKDQSSWSSWQDPSVSQSVGSNRWRRTWPSCSRRRPLGRTRTAFCRVWWHARTMSNVHSIPVTSSLRPSSITPWQKDSRISRWVELSSYNNYKLNSIVIILY